MNKVVEYIIGAKDATGNAIKSALNRLKSFAASVGSNLQNIRAAFGMMQTAARNAVVFMQKAFAFEKMTVQFKTLIGNMDEARSHMQMLQQMGDTPPFSLEEFAAASRSLMVMSDGALGFKKSLELVGDAAAATGQPIQNLAHEVGRAYAIIRDGQPLTRATMGLRNMGAITPEVAAKLDELQKSGASVQQIWETLTAELGKFKGAMAETEKTGDGLIGAIKSQWDNTLRDFGAACMETCKDGLQALLSWLKRIRSDGSIDRWAQSANSVLRGLAGTVRTVAGAFEKLYDAYRWVQDTGEKIGAAVGGYIGTLAGGGSFEDAEDAAGRAYAQTEAEQADRERQREREAEEARLRAADRAAQREREAAEAEKREQERIQKQLAEAQEKLDRKNAEEKAKADAEAAKKAAQEEEKARRALEREIAKERERLWRANVKAMEKEYHRAQSEEADARSRLADATAKESQAWGWYRDRDSWTAQLAEERADAEAQKQFDKDFSKLKDRYRDWRTSDRLSDDDELIRRVALAREEKAAAEEYAKQTAEATQACADALEAIQEVMTTEEA